ncbi:thiosulfate oxidation carrier complex protein SoxZ [Candidatus Entotheonella palauensis]|uniref:Sulfur oxidation protein n=1 Tax=Candidatus Entotheonella gemina TaxID=1429439 RepID=W4M0X3_9BACT|nr:thiosulfate oxidation carrier complex protein SoxZ [Candidatus Entotheonella palauensis]ETX03994.1 MAG: sulfur oxidation protein [Candidatus Entotheonella gemina]
MAKPRVRVPRKPVKKGEVFEIKTLISHRMESGHRRNKKTGEPIPRKIIKKFVCTYNGEEIFSADFHPAIASNPYLAFFTVATESGELAFTWIDDDQTRYETTASIVVE